MTFERDEPTFSVVVNDEGQYSIWPQYKDVPLGWRATGFAGLKENCLSHIEVVWTDMRPRSLREEMTRAMSAPET